MTIRAVLFDVGGPIDTEVTRERLIDAHIREAVEERGIAVTDEDFTAAGEWAVETFAPDAYAAIIWRLTGHDADLARAVLRAVRARAPERQVFELRPGIGPLLAELRERGLRLGLASNAPASAIGVLDRAGIGRHFHHREVSESHGFQKPDTRLFLRACEDLSVDPSECIMVGDRMDNDIVPAIALGMRTILFRTGRHAGQRPRSWLEIPDMEVKTVEELRKALATLAPR